VLHKCLGHTKAKGGISKAIDFTKFTVEGQNRYIKFYEDVNKEGTCVDPTTTKSLTTVPQSDLH
jgi:hypothetical protein